MTSDPGLQNFLNPAGLCRYVLEARTINADAEEGGEKGARPGHQELWRSHARTVCKLGICWFRLSVYDHEIVGKAVLSQVYFSWTLIRF